jgi:biopolymer transport protein ExbD
MAELDTSGGGGKKKGSKKASTRIDMTPMVDLAFLLITFFMLTSSFNKPKTMEVNMPDKNEDPEKNKEKVSEKQTLTVIMGDKDKVYYFQGVPSDKPPVEVTDYSDEGIRKVLIAKRKEIQATLGKDIIVIMKAKDSSKYKNLVDILDEMPIAGIKIYAIVDITPEELELIKSKEL